MTRILLLDENQKIFGAVKDPLEAYETSEINVAHTISYTVANTLENWAQVDQASYVAVPVADDTENQWHLFAINDPKTNGHTLTVDGIEEAYDDLRAYGYLTDHRPKDAKLSDIATTIFDGTRWTVFKCPDLIGSQNMYYISRLEALQTLVKTFDVEVDFTYVIEGNEIKERRVNIYEKMGRDTHRRFVYGSNALTIDKEEKRDGIFTAMVGRGKGVETTDENDDPTGNFGRRLTLADAEWSVAAGDPIDKPKGQEWMEIPEATKQWGYSDGTPKTGIQVFEDDTDVKDLMQHTYDYLVSTCRPLLQLSATIAKLGFDAHLGDTVILVRHELKMVYTARIFKLKRNLLNNLITEVTFGDYLLESAADRAISTQRAITDMGNSVRRETRSLYNQLKSESDARLAEADKQSKALEDKLTAQKEANDKAVEDLTNHMNERVEAAEKLVAGLQDGVYTFENAWAAKFSDDNLKALFAVQVENGNASLVAQMKDEVSGQIGQMVLDQEGFQTKIEDSLKGQSSTISQLSNQISLKANSTDVKADITAATNQLNLSITNLKNGAIASLQSTVDGLAGWQQTVKDPTTGLKAQMTQMVSAAGVTWNNKLSDATSNLTAQMALQIKNGLASFDLAVAGGYLSITGNGSTSKVWLGGSNLTLTGDTHIQGDVIIDNVNQYGHVHIEPTGLHIIDDYANEDMGYIHSNNYKDKNWFNGLAFDLNPQGDFMSWGHRESTNDLFTDALVYFPRFAQSSNAGYMQGFTFVDNVSFNGQIYGWGSFKSAAHSHLHFQEYTGDHAGLALVNDNGTGILIANGGDVWALERDTPHKI